MLQKETQFDFSKEVRENNINKNNVLIPTINFMKKHKKILLIGMTVFIAYKTLNYFIEDTPEQAKTKLIAMQTATQALPNIIKNIEKNKNNYNEVVNYLIEKEYDIATNAMTTMQLHADNLNKYNINFKNKLIDKQNSLEIIEKKLNESKSYNALTSEEKDILMDEYKNYQLGKVYMSNDMDATINKYTTVDYDDKPDNVEKVKELKKARETIKLEVSQIKKKGLK